MRDKTFEELDVDFESYSDLTQVQGPIIVSLMIKCSIKALIQWAQGQYRMGLNPENMSFPYADATMLLRNQQSHAIIMTKSIKIVNNAKPFKYDESTKRED